MKPNFLKIKYKLVIAFLILGIAPFAIMGIISFFNSGKVLTNRAFEQLKSIREVKKAQMENFFEDYKKDLGLLAHTVASLEQSAFNKLNTVQENKQANLQEYFQKIFSDIQVISKNTAVIQALADFSSVINKDKKFDPVLFDFFDRIKYGQTLSQFKEEYHYQDLMLVNVRGDIVFTINREKDLGQNLLTGNLRGGSLARCFKNAKTAVHIEDFFPYTPSGGRYFAFAGAPVMEKNGDFAGVVILKIDNTVINRIAQRRLGMGKSGETYILGNISNRPEYRSDQVIKKTKLGQHPNDHYLEDAIAKTSGPFIKTSDTGEMEIVKYDTLKIHGLDWAVVTTMALEEAISPTLSEQQDYFSHFSRIYGIKDFYLIALNGDAFYSVTHGKDYNTNLLHGDYADSGLGHVFRQTKKSGTFQFIDFNPYEPINDEPAAFLGLPVIRKNKPHMIMAIRISYDRINTIMRERTGMGRSGKIYLVGPDHLLRSDRFIATDSRSATASFKNPDQEPVKTKPVAEALSGKSGAMITVDYRGTEVLSAFTPMNAWGQTWGLLVEMDKTEALALLGTLKLTAFLIALGSIAAIVFISLIIARHFAKPISQLTEGAELVKERNFDISVDVKSNDEMELMADAFNSMVKEIRTFSGELQEKVSLLESAETQLKRTNTLLTAVLEGTTDAIFIKDLNGKYILANTATCKALGKPLEEILNKDDTRLFPEESVRVINDIDKKVMETGKTRLSEERLQTAYGDSYWLSNKSPYLDRDGNVIGLIGISRNITMLKTAQKEKEELADRLKQAHKMEAIGTLAGGIAHDFNNILAAIIGYTEIVLDDLDPENDLKRSVDEILKAAFRAKQLVQQILAFSRKKEHTKTPVNLNSLINEAIKLLRATIPATIDIQQDLKADNTYILADSTQIHQVVMNICTNAAQAIENESGKIEFSLDIQYLKSGDLPGEPELKPGEYVRFSVKDTGTGIDPELLERVFDPYFTTKDVGKGSGMGLAVAHGIIKSHDGYIAIESHQGIGSICTVYFPKIIAAVSHETQEHVEMTPGNEHVLLIDDEISILKILEERLKRLGYQTTTATSSKDALELFTSDPGRFDIIITDQTMPHMTGIQLAKEIYGIRKEVPIILCTGYSSQVNEEEAKKIGINAFLFKPVESHKLIKTMRNVLDG